MLEKKTKMAEQKPEKRIRNFNEVALGYIQDEALEEASRCLQCKKPLCIDGCPVEINIPAFIEKIMNKDYMSAIGIIKDKNSLPVICGRVCPQETQCEQTCILGKKKEPVAIGRLERFASDWEFQHGVSIPQTRSGHCSTKVAVVGSGPDGCRRSCKGRL